MMMYIAAVYQAKQQLIYNTSAKLKLQGIFNSSDLRHCHSTYMHRVANKTALICRLS